MLRTTTLMLLVGLLFIPSDNTPTPAPCDECEKNLSLLREQFDREAALLFQVREERDSLWRTSERLQFEILNLRDGNNIDIIEPITAPPLAPVAADCSALELENRRLTDANNGLRQDNRNLNHRIGELEAQIDELNGIIQEQANEIERLKGEIQVLKARILILQQQVDCVQAFLTRRDSLLTNAKILLTQADTLYNKFINYGNDKWPDTTKARVIQEVWAVYSAFGPKEITESCPGFSAPLSTTLNYKNGRQHLNSAEIIAKDYGGIVSKITAGEDWQKTNEIYNELFLTELAQALAKAGQDEEYDLRNDAKEMIGLVPVVVKPEPKPGDGGLQGLLVAANTSFEDENFPAVLASYNQSKQYLKTDSAKGYEKEIAQLEYMVGVILLRNLSNASTYHPLAIPRSWLHDTTKSWEKQKEEATKLLFRVANNKDLPIEMREKAYLALQIKYDPK